MALLRGLLTVLLLVGHNICQATENSEEEFLQAISLEALLNINLTGAAVRDLGLNKIPESGNKLELTAFKLPFAIDVIDSNTTRARGLKSVTEAAEHLVGIISGESPAEPSSFSMRGFIRDSVIILRDGIRLGPASMTMRPQNTFNLKQMEIVKGPASLHYGPATASGIINMITKKPAIGQAASTELFVSHGHFNTSEWGLGLSGSMKKNLAYRLDINKAESNGWVDETPSDSLNITASLLWQQSQTLSVMLGFDYLKDDLPAYWGTPLIPVEAAGDVMSGIITTDDGRVLDSGLRFNNYNISDQRSDSEHLWTKLTTFWQASEKMTIKNILFHFNADRAWKNAESYVFDNETSRINRDRFFVFHDHEFYGNQLDININYNIAQYQNTLSLGIDYSKTDFSRARGFPDGDSVDLINPEQGMFGLLESRLSPTKIDKIALLLEDTFFIAEHWQITLGLRKDHIKTSRDNYDVNGNFLAQSSFNRTFKPLSYRVATSYQITDELSLYAQWGTGHDPVGSNIYLVNANENFDFTDIRQYEAGIKSISNDEKIEITAAVYDIKRENILLLTSHDTVGNSGSQVSQGFELAASASLSENSKIGGNVAYTKAEYKAFVDPDFGTNASGKTPPNVPKWVANAWISHNNIFDLPIELGGGLRYVGERTTNFQNTVFLKEYLLTNLFAAYSVDNARFAVNIRNVFDEEYAPWGDIFYPNQIAIGSPRTLELSFHIKF